MDVEFPQARYNICVLKEGSRTQKDEHISVSGSIILIQGAHTILVGTGLPCEQKWLQEALQREGLTTDDVEYVICTYAHPETVGNLGMFPQAIHIVGFDIINKDKMIMHDFHEGIPFEIDEDLEVLPTPGVCSEAVSVKLTNTSLGTVAIAGSCFTSEEDLEDPDVWMNLCKDVDVQEQSRITLLEEVTHIIPRYGPLFRVPDSYKREMKVIMTPS